MAVAFFADFLVTLYKTGVARQEVAAFARYIKGVFATRPIDCAARWPRWP